MAETEFSTGKAPAFQFYPSDFVNGTLILTTEEVGAYMLLICHCWDKGSIPKDLTLLSRIARLTPAKMRRAWSALVCKFVEQDGVYIQPRLERERQKQQEYRRRQSDAAAKRWDKRGNATASAPQMPEPSRGDALQSSVSNLQSSDFSQKNGAAVVDHRSKRPIFKGQRLTIFEWMLDDLSKLLGKHAEAFDLHSWFYTLDAMVTESDVLVPQRDGGKWLQERTTEEALRRGIPLAVASHNPKTAGNLAAAARFVARGQQ